MAGCGGTTQMKSKESTFKNKLIKCKKQNATTEPQTLCHKLQEFITAAFNASIVHKTASQKAFKPFIIKITLLSTTPTLL